MNGFEIQRYIWKFKPEFVKKNISIQNGYNVLKDVFISVCIDVIKYALILYFCPVELARKILEYQ